MNQWDGTSNGILPIRSGFGLPHRLHKATAAQLSVVIPAFNEETRIGSYLAAIREYLTSVYPNDSEVIVVDDGSRDGTADLVGGLAEGWPELRLIRHGTNRGKGAAICTGVQAARGRRILFADADGATPIEEERRLAIALANGARVAAASRYRPGDVSRERNARRGAAGAVFRFFANRLVGVGVTDTQCGFKMFESGAAARLFELSRETGYLLDLEVLALARQFDIPVAEVAVNWSEKPGSKLRMVRDSLRMFAGLWRLRRRLRNTLAPTQPSKARAA